MKLNVRRLTQTELKESDTKCGKLNESLIDALQPSQTLLYKKLILDLGIDESVAAFTCL